MKERNDKKDFFYNKKTDIEKKQWSKWEWQVENSISDIEKFEEKTKIFFERKIKEDLKKVIAKFPFLITPYYLNLVDIKNYSKDPIFLQAFPNKCELNIKKYEKKDPLLESVDSPVKGIIHRYPDRVLFNVSNICACYCRFCTRKRMVGKKEKIINKNQIIKAIEYIRKTPKIRDVLISGGDPLMLKNDLLDFILGELNTVKNIEVVRIGSRIPAVLPFRIDEELLKVLKRHKPIWINTHFNHPKEITNESQEALGKLADCGIPLGNQSVLLSGVNDDPWIQRKLYHDLVRNRVRPYYLYQCDLNEGIEHFRTRVDKGIEIIESLIGHTSGFCIPRYVIDSPGGGGKIPIMPNYLISTSSHNKVLRNYMGEITNYEEPINYNDKKNKFNKKIIDCIKKRYHENGIDSNGVFGMISD